MVKLHKSIYPIILTDEDETKDGIGRYRKSICHGSTSVHDFFFKKRSLAREITQWVKALTVPAQGSEFKSQS